MTPERAAATPANWWHEFQTFTIDTNDPPRPAERVTLSSAAEPGPLGEVLTPPQVADWLQVPERTLDDWRYMKKGPPFHKVGKHIRYVAEEVRAWLACQ